MKSELVSIIVPVYNGENHIANIVNALKNQTYSNFEVIVVNDGSSDNTEQEYQKAVEGDTRFHLINKANSGPSDSRNVGLTNAGGEYVAFVDADDYIFPDYLQYLWELMQKHNADITCCDYCKVQFGQEIPDFGEGSVERVFDRIAALNTMYRKKYITGYPYLKLFRRRILQNIFFPTEIDYAEDIVFVDKAIKNSQKVVYGDAVLYIYYQHVSSLTHQIDIERLRSSWRYHLNYFNKDTTEEFQETHNAVKCKQFVMAMDLCSRVYKQDKVFCKELLRYAKNVAQCVTKDCENTKLQRLLAVLCCISPKGTVVLCRVFNWFKVVFNVQMKKAV